MNPTERVLFLVLTGAAASAVHAGYLRRRSFAFRASLVAAIVLGVAVPALVRLNNAYPHHEKIHHDRYVLPGLGVGLALGLAACFVHGWWIRHRTDSSR